MPLAAPIPDACSPRVDTWYTPWDKLPEDMANAVAALYYNQLTWENYGTYLIKEMLYAGLMKWEEKAVVLFLGYADPELWDCWQNHYKLQVDQHWGGICPGKAVVGGVRVGHILVE
jgi:hypothetical protein